MKNSFVFYASFYEAISLLPNENQLKVYQAISQFALTEKEPTNLTAIEKAVFILVKPQIIANNERYENGCKGAEFGRLGGRPKKKTETPEKPQQNPIGVIVKNPNKTPNENDNENENENVIKEKEVKKEKEKPQTQVSQTQVPQAIQPPAIPAGNPKPEIIKPQTPRVVTEQQEIFDYFSAKYKALSGKDYLPDKKDFILLTQLNKLFGVAEVKQRIDWLEIGCRNGIFWFAKEANDFTIGNLRKHWNEILPKLTDEQRKEAQKRRKDEETKKRILANLAEEEKLRRQANGGRL